MKLWPFGRRRDPFDPEALMAEVAQAWGATREPAQVAADFRQLLLGSEQGKRVLYQIFVWGHFWGPSMAADPQTTAFKEGERSVALKVMAALRNDPKPLPTRQRAKPEK